MGKMASVMITRPPTEPLSRRTRLLAAVIIAIAALGITWLALLWLPQTST